MSGDSDSNKIRVLLACDFSDELIQQIRDVSDKLLIEHHFPHVPEAADAQAEVLYTIRHFPEPSQAPHLRWIQLHYAGVERALNQPIIQAEDVIVTNASGVHAVPMTEYCLTMMLAFEYRLPRLLHHQQQMEWPEDRWSAFRPHGLRGKVLGIAGYGNIGRELARAASALGMKILATKRDLMQTANTDSYIEEGLGDPTGDIPERLYPPEALASMAQECDYLVIVTPLTDKTHHMVNEKVFKAMKNSAVLINIGRGSVVDEAALVSALAAKEIGGAALDVYETEPLPSSSPLWNMDNVILTPHISGNNLHYHERAAKLFIENLRRYIENRPLLNVVRRDLGY